MECALKEAERAYKIGEVPVGAVVVRNGEVIAAGYNRRETGKNALYHAEILAIDAACQKLGGWRLHECELYVTLEPCPMCCGAIIHARLKKLVFGAYDPKGGACGSLTNLFSLPFSHHPEVIGGIMEPACRSLMDAFFKKLREQNSRHQGGTAYCGLACSECPVYLATLSGNEQQKQQLAELYTVPGFAFTAKDINCEGCRASSSSHSKMCSACPIRCCARSKGVKTCADCGKYPCSTIEKQLPDGSDNRKRLDNLKKKS